MRQNVPFHYGGIGTFLVMVSIALVAHHDHRHLGNNGLFGLHTTSLSSLEEEVKAGTKKVSDLEAGAKAAEARVEHCLLASSPCLAQPAFFQNLGAPAKNRLQTQWAGPSSTNH